jgi:cytochrome c-type biogenesis protein CcmH
MLQGLPEDSPWREVVQQAIAGLRADTPQGTREADGERGPDDADVEAAALMSEEDRADMIDGMVAGLDRRLRDNPQDIDGWRRLVRSYLVLDRREEAQQALARGLAALGPGEKADDLAAYANDLGLDAEGREP